VGRSTHREVADVISSVAARRQVGPASGPEVVW